MRNPRFLFDENVPGPLTQAFRRHAAAIEILCIGEPGAPPYGTLDPQNLLASEALERILLTNDKDSMWGHLQDHHNAGHHTWGVFMMKKGHSLQSFFDEVELVWGAADADEWRDVTRYIPSMP